MTARPEPHDLDNLAEIDSTLDRLERDIAIMPLSEEVSKWLRAHEMLRGFRVHVAARHTPVAQGPHETSCGPWATVETSIKEVSTVVYALLRYHEDRAESLTFPYVFTEVDHRRAAETLASLHARLGR